MIQIWLKNWVRRLKSSGFMFFGSKFRGIVSDFRSDESFPVKTGSCRKMIFGASIKAYWEGQSGKVSFLPPEDGLPVQSGYNSKTGNYPLIFDRPLFWLTMVDFLIKILGTIPWKGSLPVLSPENRLNRKKPLRRQCVKTWILLSLDTQLAPEG